MDLNASSEGPEVGVNAKNISNKSESRTELVELKREVGLWNGVGITVGSMIGSGIFVSPGTVLKYSGSIGMSLIVWVLSGLMSMCGAMCYAELGTMIPKSGGEYTYILEAFGNIPAFLNVWTAVAIVSPAGRAVSLLAFATYVLQPLFPDCDGPPFWAVRLVALALLCFLGYINYSGIKMSTRLQNALTLVKLLALLVIIVIGIVHLAGGNTENYQEPMAGTSTSPFSIATTFYSTTFSYGGWEFLNNMTEEVKNPNKILPRTIVTSVAIVTVIYVLINIAYFAVLTPSEILSSSAVAVTFGNQKLGIIAWTISIFVACSIFGSLNGGIMTFSRVLYAGAREGHLPKCFSLVHINNKTPGVAIIASLIGSSVVIFANDYASILAYLSFAMNLMNLLCVLAFLWFRYNQPERHRPIKVWFGFPAVYLVLNIFITIFPIIEQPTEIATAAAILVLGLLVYYLAIYKKNETIGRCMDKVYYLCQMLFLCVEEEKSDK
ncbi:Y+L amino acid transporter 2 [Halocaridina rubra]|uniref:Y+L amino acid transporter 2 n=1 Tax=Halocaridina rubra TaxID=373956 RepID=A0AAN8WVB1_HALRR